MSFQTFNLSSKIGPNTPKPSSTVPLGAAGQVADHQPCWLPASVGQESADKENAPLHEYGVQPSRPIATNNYIRALTSASNNGDTITATAYSRVSPRKKVARPALLVPPSSPSPSSPTEPTTSRPRKLAGKRSSPSNDFTGPSSPPKKARRLEEEGSETSASSHSGLSSGSKSRPITPPPTLVSTRDIATSPQPSPGEVRPKTPESVLGRPRLREQYIIEATNTSHRSPGEDGDETSAYKSDPSDARGGRENSRAATMATRIAEVHKLEEQYVDLMAKLHGGDPTDPLADNELEDNFAAANAAHKAWQDAKLRLSSPASDQPTMSTTLASTMNSPALNSVSGGYGESMIEVMREPYLVLLAHLDSVLPKLPVVATNTSDGGVETVESTVESADAHDEEPTIPNTPPPPPIPSEDPQSEGVAPPASLTPSSEPTSVGVQSELPGNEEVTPSASSIPPVPDAPTTSSSVASAASTPFRFSEDDEALLLGHTRAKRYTAATDMLPQSQQGRVITTPTEIAAVRLVHPRRTVKPPNKGKSRSRETRSHIGEDGVETELWVCRASFEVDEGGVSYLASPCGMPVGTKDSWKRHLREKHFGRESRK